MILIYLGIAFVIVVVCVFSNISGLLMTPLVTPADFLSGMPYTTFSLFGRELVLIQPSSTFLVYFLGAVMTILGIYFLVTKGVQKSRNYWGIGLIFWGISAIVAGTSYQAFGYELKCQGQPYCLFTSNFELVYMLLTAYCINFLVVATGYTSLSKANRKRIIYFALIDSAAYSIYMFVGAITPIKFLISYEGFMAFIGLNFILMFVLSIRHYTKHKDILNRNLIIIWVGFLVVNIGYFVFLLGGIGLKLYTNAGIWFNENDALHVLLILWTLLIFILLRRNLADTTHE